MTSWKIYKDCPESNEVGKGKERWLFGNFCINLVVAKCRSGGRVHETEDWAEVLTGSEVNESAFQNS